jgi:hypothetical protein
MIAINNKHYVIIFALLSLPRTLLHMCVFVMLNITTSNYDELCMST